MVRVISFAAMTLGAFIFWQTMDKLHVWIALHQDEKGSVYIHIASQKHRFILQREREKQEMEIARVKAELLRQLKEKESHI